MSESNRVFHLMVQFLFYPDIHGRSLSFLNEDLSSFVENIVQPPLPPYLHTYFMDGALIEYYQIKFPLK